MNAFAIRCVGVGAAALISLAAFAAPNNNPGAGQNGIQGSVSATDSSCAKINGNTFASKDAVYVKPGPSTGGGAPLQDGAYYVKVTTPQGAVLGAGTGTTAAVLNGKINNADCVSLNSLVGGSYADTTSASGEYKLWLSTTSGFSQNTTKTDNFKIAGDTGGDDTVYGSVTILKFYDANVSGNYEDGEAALSWKVQLSELDAGTTPVTYSPLALGDYTAREYEPLGNSVKNGYAWVATNAYQIPGTWNFDGPDGGGGYLNRWPTPLTIAAPDVTVVFGNVCIGPATGGRSIGYWTNKNGQAAMNAVGMSYALTNLGLLVDAKGQYFVPSNYSDFRKWLSSATATNMQYMLSAQKVAVKLAVLTGALSATDHVYAPGAPAAWGANPAGFIAIGDLLAYAENQLSLNPEVRAGISLRTEMEALKNAFENIALNHAAIAQPSADACGTPAF